MRFAHGLVFVLISACAANNPRLPTTLVQAPSVHISEAMERAWVARDPRARLIHLGGDARQGTTLTIHGMNASPDDVAALSLAGLVRGEQVLTFAYDDNYRRLQATADDFAQQIDVLERSLPAHARLNVEAHSMGARAVVVALARLQRVGRISRRLVELHLIAPLLRGVGAAGSAWLMTLFLPFGLSSLIKNIEPAQDLGPRSDFQRAIEAARFRDNVRVSVTLAEHDRVSKPDATTLRLARRWGAPVRIIAGATHQSVLALASLRRSLAQLARQGFEPGQICDNAQPLGRDVDAL